jgi:hydroxyethylthiazole kinase-like sugar kinase family protein
VHFSRRSFSPYIALVFLLSHGISFSPDAALRNVGEVVVAASGRVDVVRTGSGEVVATESEALLQAISPNSKGRSRSAFFTFLFCQENDFPD